MRLNRGATLGPYEIQQPLGAGGMGEVYKARDPRLNRTVAIKVSKTQFTDRFEREARAIAALNHPNVCALYDIGPDYLVMEFVEGPTLASRIAAGPIPVEEALAIARQIAEALEAAHEKGIVHRDLKPANVKVTSEGAVKVLDFGLATASVEVPNSTDSPTLTISPTIAGTILGTAAYMAPEQARGAAVDKRADIWAFGVVLFEMLSGKMMFAGETVSDILAGVLRADPDWNALPSGTPLRIRRLLRRCLERDRKQRLRDIGEARIVIDAPEEHEQPQPLRKARPIWPWGTALIAAVSLAAMGWWQAVRLPPPRSLIRLSADLAPAALDGRSLMALSPDGTKLAFATRGPDGKAMLAVRSLDQNQVVSFSGTENASSPFFSPDGNWLGLFEGGRLKKISVGGGVAVPLLETGSQRGASFGDGFILAPLGVATGLSRIPIAGGTPVAVTELNRENDELAHRWPQVLPGGQTALFTVYHITTNYDNADIEAVSLQTGKRQLVYRGGFYGRYVPGGYLVYVHQNILFAARFDLRALKLIGEPQPVVQGISNQMDAGANFDVSETGTLVYVGGGQLQRSIFSLDGAGKPQPLQSDPGLYGFPRFSPDGKRLAFILEDGQGRGDIWIRDLERGITSRLTSMPGRSECPVWTPDGKNIIFGNLSPPVPGFYAIRSDGTGAPVKLTDGKFGTRPSSISPDGKWLAAFQTTQGNGVGIFKWPIEGDPGHLRLGPAQPFLVTPFLNILPAFSPDGRWLAYFSAEPGKAGLWVRPSSGQGGAWQIGNADGRFSFPLWSQKRLFFLEDRRRIMMVDYTVQGDSFVAGQPRPWSEQLVLNLGSPPVYTYDVAPDGKRLAVVLYPDGTADEKPITHVTFLINFADYLRQRLGGPEGTHP